MRSVALAACQPPLQAPAGGAAGGQQGWPPEAPRQQTQRLRVVKVLALCRNHIVRHRFAGDDRTKSKVVGIVRILRKLGLLL